MATRVAFIMTETLDGDPEFRRVRLEAPYGRSRNVMERWRWHAWDPTTHLTVREMLRTRRERESAQDTFSDVSRPDDEL